MNVLLTVQRLLWDIACMERQASIEKILMWCLKLEVAVI